MSVSLFSPLKIKEGDSNKKGPHSCDRGRILPQSRSRPCELTKILPLLLELVAASPQAYIEPSAALLFGPAQLFQVVFDSIGDITDAILYLPGYHAGPESR
ncbi:hypothetical protein VUR80DRAFT_382 [Thermomyces stellatus]